MAPKKICEYKFKSNSLRFLVTAEYNRLNILS